MTKTKMNNVMNKIGEVINVKEAACREFDVQWLHNIVARSGINRAGSWGFKSPVITLSDKAYRFTVSGHHHKGHVHIVLNVMDTFDIYYCSNRGTIKKIDNGIYVDQLIDILDGSIERIAEYVR